MTRPLARTIILTDSGAVPFSQALAVYDGTPVGLPVLLLVNVLANSTTVRANRTNFRQPLLDLQNRLHALGANSMFDINFGSGPDTPTGDSVAQAVFKLSASIAVLEAVAAGGGTPTPSPQPTLSLSAPVVASEGNSGTTNLVYTLTLDRDGLAASIPFHYAVSGATANPVVGADFIGGVLPSGDDAFAPGQTSKTISLPVAGDVSIEFNEGLLLTVTSPGLTTVTATGTIGNDDVAAFEPVTLAFPAGRVAGANPVKIDITSAGDAIIGTHSLRLEQSQDNFATPPRESEPVPFDSDFVLAGSEDEDGFDWQTLGIEPAGPWQGRISTLVTATGEVVATSNVISDTLIQPSDFTFVSFNKTSGGSPGGSTAFAAGPNLVTVFGSGDYTLAVAGATSVQPIAATGPGQYDTNLKMFKVVVPTAGNYAYSFTGYAGGRCDISVFKMVGIGELIDTEMFVAGQRNPPGGDPKVYTLSTTLPAGASAFSYMFCGRNVAPITSVNATVERQQAETSEYDDYHIWQKTLIAGTRDLGITTAADGMFSAQLIAIFGAL